MAANEQQSDSLQIQAYETIRSGIVYAHYAPGDKLQVKDLCADLDMGRTPIRESLVRLRQEGLVRTVPQSGTYVREISLSSVESARYVRENLETHISVAAAALATQDDLSHLQSILESEQEARRRGDRRAFFESDNEFHKTIYQIAHKERIWGWLEQISTDLKRYRWLRVKTEELDWGSIDAQHRAIFDAIAQRNTDDVRFLVANHLHLLFSESAVVMERFPTYFVDDRA